MLNLRGHHLVCLHFFKGEGYNKKFVDNLESILLSARHKEIEVCPGADDVCAECPYLDHSRCRHSQTAEKGIREMDRRALELLELSHGMKVRWAEIEERIPGIFPAWHREYCASCSWKRACEGNELFQKLKEGLSKASHRAPFSDTRTRPHRNCRKRELT